MLAPLVITRRAFDPSLIIVEAYAGFVAAFREGAEKLRDGDRMARFLEGSLRP